MNRKSIQRVSIAMSCALCASGALGQHYPAPVQALRGKGVAIDGRLQAPAGFEGYVGTYDGDRIPVYLLPDGHHIVIGTLYDTQGNDLTAVAFAAATQPGMDPSLWSRLQRSTWFAEGAAKPKHIVYVFTDTECRYCHALWLELQPYMRRDQVQVRNIIVAVIAFQSMGRGAAVLASDDPAAVWQKHERAFGHSQVTPLAAVEPGLRSKIDANTALIKSIDSFGTPAIVYRDGKGKIRMILGMPDKHAIEAVFGG